MSFDAAIDRRLNVPSGLLGKGKPAWVKAPVADLRPKPDPSSGIDTQLIFGASVLCYGQTGGFTLVQAQTDGYVGYLETLNLSEGESKSTHKVTVPRTFRYASPDMKTPRVDALSIGSRVCVTGNAETRGTEYALLEDGSAIIAKHILPLTHQQSDPVVIAETLIHTPYLWGGASAFGIDCSGLVQLSFAMAGIKVLRDTDMQAATIGEPVDKAELKRGDLIYWKGHAALCRGDGTIIHANGHTMSVAIEGLEDAIARIGYLYGEPTAFLRPYGQSA